MEKLTGFSTLDLIMKNRGQDATFQQIDVTEGHVTIDGYTISERTNLMNDWNSVLIKGNDVRICRRYNSKSIAQSAREDLNKYISNEILALLKSLNIIK